MFKLFWTLKCCVTLSKHFYTRSHTHCWWVNKCLTVWFSLSALIYMSILTKNLLTFVMKTKQTWRSVVSTRLYVKFTVTLELVQYLARLLTDLQTLRNSNFCYSFLMFLLFTHLNMLIMMIKRQLVETL